MQTLAAAPIRVPPQSLLAPGLCFLNEACEEVNPDLGTVKQHFKSEIDPSQYWLKCEAWGLKNQQKTTHLLHFIHLNIVDKNSD